MANLLLNPEAFFRDNDEPFWYSWGYYAAIVFIISLLGLGFLVYMQASAADYFEHFVEFVQSILSPAISAAFISVGMKLVGGTGTYKDNIKIASYTSLVGMLYGLVLIPIVLIIVLMGILSPASFFALFLVIIYVFVMLAHMFFIEVAGVVAYHDVNYGKAFFGAVVIPFCIMIALLAVFGAVFGTIYGPL